MAGAGSSADLPAGQRPVPFRAWLLAMATGVLVLESVLAGRGEARFLRPAALAPGYPQAGQRWTQMVLLTLALLLIVAALFQVPLLLPERSRHLVLVRDGGLVETSDPRWERLEDRLQGEPRGARLTTLILPGEGFGGLDLETGLRLAEAEIPKEHTDASSWLAVMARAVGTHWVHFHSCRSGVSLSMSCPCQEDCRAIW